MTKEPMTERGRRSRDRIVESAADLVASRGVEGTGIDQVLAAAGASKSQLYHYFADKDDLIRAVIARRFEQMIGAQSPLLTSLDSWQAIRQWLDLWIDMSAQMGQRGCPIGTLASELAGRDEAARGDLAACFATWESYLVDGLTRMAQRGDLSQDADPRHLTIALFASLQGGLLLAKTYRDGEPLRIALDAAYSHLLSFRTLRAD